MAFLVRLEALVQWDSKDFLADMVYLVPMDGMESIRLMGIKETKDLRGSKE